MTIANEAPARKVILITGGSEGLGLEIATKLRAENEVVVLSNNKSVDGFYCDITNPVQIETVVSEVVAKFGRIDCLINNAGVWVGGELDTNSYDQIAKVVLVNTIGTINMTKAVIPVMKKQAGGKIITICSYDGTITKPERGPYVASKWAITGFTGSMRKELESRADEHKLIQKRQWRSRFIHSNGSQGSGENSGFCNFF
jgi:NAD(P)-dependent dehydrogenase (short-subunit alcohol dehydrogenase family)